MAGRVVALREGAIGWIVFAYPERRNAVSQDMWRTIPSALRDLTDDRPVRVVVLRGEGELAFVSGADISEFEKGRTGEAVAQYEADSVAALHALSTCPKPVVAMVHGFCMGGGLAIALAADLRYAADDASFAIPAARLGVGYPASGVDTLVRTVGPASANEIFFTARRFDAAEALARGVVNAVKPKSELEAFVRSTCSVIAQNAPLTLRSFKLAAREFGKSGAARDDAAVEASVAACFASDDYREGVAAFLEKRTPVFRGE
jgi:enoyl-CoA hydratase/carnithine racemase